MAKVTPQTGHSGKARVDVFLITAAAFATTPLFSFTMVKGFNRAGHVKKKSLKLTFEEYTDNEAIELHIQAYLNSAAAAGKTVGEIEFDNGDTIFGDAAAGDVLSFGYIAYETQFVKVKITEGIGSYTGATGDKKISARGANFYPIEISSVESTEITAIPIACYQTSIVTAPGAAGSIALGDVGNTRSLTAAV